VTRSAPRSGRLAPRPATLTAGAGWTFTVTAPTRLPAPRQGLWGKVSRDLRRQLPPHGAGRHQGRAHRATVKPVADRFVEVAAWPEAREAHRAGAILGTQLAQAQVRWADRGSLRIFRVQAVTASPTRTAPRSLPTCSTSGIPCSRGLLDVKVEPRGGPARSRHDRAGAGAAPESGLAVDALGMIGAVQRSTELAQALRDSPRSKRTCALAGALYRAGPRAAPGGGGGGLERQTIPALAGALAAELRVREQQLASGGCGRRRTCGRSRPRE